MSVALGCDRDVEAPSCETSASLARCLDCACALEGAAACPACARRYAEENGILEAIGPLCGTNRVAESFYNGASWPKFRRWERLFLEFQGGQRGARKQILRHLPTVSNARVLEVGIGDGENVPLLPASWTIHGVDLARNRLRECLNRFPALDRRLVLAEAEVLPFEDGVFDAVFSVGGFNYFRDHAAALREMRRVARRGATLVVADEITTLYRFAPGHFFGLEELDRSLLRGLGLEREFIDMVLGPQADITAIAAREWPGHTRYRIWNRLGYCLVDSK